MAGVVPGAAGESPGTLAAGLATVVGAVPGGLRDGFVTGAGAVGTTGPLAGAVAAGGGGGGTWPNDVSAMVTEQKLAISSFFIGLIGKLFPVSISN